MRLTRRIGCWLTLLSSLFLATNAFAAYELNMPRGVTPISHDVYDLHMTILYLCLGIGVIVFSVMFYAIVRHRKSRGVKPATFHENSLVEFIWAVIPMIILIAMAIPATKVLIAMSDADNSEITIKVTGYQWKWQYEYLDEGLSFFSNLATAQAEIDNTAPKDRWYLLEVDNPVVVPIDTKVRFLITSNDVIHSWWVPALSVKKDAVPGYIHEVWAKIQEPGIYRGQCAELCGANHGFMPIVVVAKTKEDYAVWLAQQQAQVQNKQAISTHPEQPLTKEQLMTQGEQDYSKFCAMCHKADGTGMPPAFPALKGSSIVLGPISAHIDIVLNGKPGTAMQAFASQLNDEQIAAIITYQRNAWGNNTGDLVQPADIQAARAKQ